MTRNIPLAPSHESMTAITIRILGPDDASVLEHNGILSTFYSEAVLLPETGYGFVLLYNVHSVAQDMLGFPRFKNGLIALLTGNAPPTGGLSVGIWGVILFVVTLLSVTLVTRSLLHLPQWAQQAYAIPVWRLLPGIVFAFLPLMLVLAMPALVLAASGRAFGYLTLFRSMLGVMIWLSLVGLLGAVNGTARLILLSRCAIQAKHSILTPKDAEREASG